MSMTNVSAGIAVYILLCFVSLKMSETGTDSKIEGDQGDDAHYCQSTLALKNILNSNVEKTLNSVSSEKFVQIYKTCYREFDKKDDIHTPSLGGSSAEAKKYQAQFNEIVKSVVSETVDETLSNLNDKLEEFEDMKKKQADSTVEWRPPGNVQLHMKPVECVVEMEIQNDLEDKVKKQQEIVNTLKTRLLQKRNKAKELHEQLLAFLNKIENSVTEKVDDDNMQ